MTANYGANKRKHTGASREELKHLRILVLEHLRNRKLVNNAETNINETRKTHKFTTGFQLGINTATANRPDRQTARTVLAQTWFECCYLDIQNIKQQTNHIHAQEHNETHTTEADLRARDRRLQAART